MELEFDESDDLMIDFLGEEHLVTPGESLTFGRRGDLVVDDNPFMHRVVGRFVHRQGVWWLQNHGTSIRVELRETATLVVHPVLPGQQVAVTPASFVIRFTAGPTDYEFEGELRRGPLGVDDRSSVFGTATVDFGSVPLSPEQHLLLVALYESSLRTGGEIEASAVLSRRLGWTAKKFHRKLDMVCDKLARAGVRGLKGSYATAADNRRTVLLNHALTSGLVSDGDLGLMRTLDHTA